MSCSKRRRPAWTHAPIARVCGKLAAALVSRWLLRLIAAGRGAMNSLMAEVLEGHVRVHVFPAAAPGSGQAEAAEELIEVVRAYLK